MTAEARLVEGPSRTVGAFIGLGIFIVHAVLIVVLYRLGWRSPTWLPFPPHRGPMPVVAGIDFVLWAAVFFASYYVPSRSFLFRFLAWAWQELPGNSSGRAGLYVFGLIWGIVGVYLVVAGLGLLG